MRRSGILFAVLILSGCGGLFYSEGDLGGTGGTGGNQPYYTLTPNGNYANDSYEIELRYSRDPSATIYYVIGVGDPQSPTALIYTGPFTVNYMTSLRAMASNNGVWSDMLDGTIVVASGSQGNPYSITNATHLYNVRFNSALHFRQDADIDLSSYSSWTPLGNSGTPFSGTYDGNGFEIRNMSIPSANTQNGLFGYCEDATLRRIKLQDAAATLLAGSSKVGLLAGFFSVAASGRIEECSVTGSVGVPGAMTVGNVGGLVGEVSGPAVISNCYSSASVAANNGTGVGGLVGALTGGGALVTDCRTEGADISGQNFVGGLVGQALGTQIVRSSTLKTVRGALYLGGVAGHISGGKVVDSFTAGTVQDGGTAGGLIGSASTSAMVSNCHSLATVTGSDYLGGLVGVVENSSTIVRSFARGPVSGGTKAGGLAGSLNTASSITACFASGSVNSGDNTGGLVGIFEGGAIADCYAWGSVTGGQNAGGLIGQLFAAGSVSRCYAAGQVSVSSNTGAFLGYSLSGGSFPDTYCSTAFAGIGVLVGGGITVTGINDLTVAQMKEQASFSGWNFATIWTIQGGVSTPYFQWQGNVNIPNP